MALGRAFWRFWCAVALANLGDGIRMTAFPLLAVSLTDEPAAVAGVAAAAALPWIVTGLLAGSLADRRGARVLICVSDATRVIVLAGLLVAVTAGAATIALVAISAFLLGVGETIRDTASQTVIPRLVPIRLIERANGRLIAAEVTANEFVGPLVGASLFAVGAALPFAANSAVLSLAVLLVLSIPGSAFTARTGVSTMTTSGVRVGVSWLLRHRLLRALAATGRASPLPTVHGSRSLSCSRETGWIWDRSVSVLCSPPALPAG